MLNLLLFLQVQTAISAIDSPPTIILLHRAPECLTQNISVCNKHFLDVYLIQAFYDLVLYLNIIRREQACLLS